MNMGAQRGLGHEAGYKQDPGQSAQITEVEDEKKKAIDPKDCPWCKGTEKNTDLGKMQDQLKDVLPSNDPEAFRKFMDKVHTEDPKFFHDTLVLGNISDLSDETREELKSAYENHEQDESPEVKPNKQQIPASKPGMDVAKSLYKKALITKYNNIYKPLNT